MALLGNRFCGRSDERVEVYKTRLGSHLWSLDDRFIIKIFVQDFISCLK